MNLSSADIKRQILLESDSSGIRHQLVQKAVSGKDEDEIVEMGEAIEGVTKHKGWAYVDAFIVRHIMALLADEVTEDQRRTATAYKRLMQYVDQSIKAKEDILARRKAAATAKENDRRPDSDREGQSE